MFAALAFLLFAGEAELVLPPTVEVRRVLYGEPRVALGLSAALAGDLDGDGVRRLTRRTGRRAAREPR